MAKGKSVAQQVGTLPARLQELPAWLKETLNAGADFDKPVCQIEEQTPLELVQKAIGCAQFSAIRFALGGYYLICAKEKDSGGSRWLARVIAENDFQVSPETLRNQMRFFELLDEMGDQDAIEAIATLDYSKVLGPLRKLGSEGLRRLALGEEVSGLTWDKACSASRRDLEAHMRRLQGEREEVLQAEQRADAAARQADELQAEVQSLREQEMHLGDLPPSVRYARVEGAAFGLMTDEGLIRLRKLLNNVYQAVDLHSDPRERQMEMELGVKAIATVCRGVIGQASQLLHHIESKTPDFLTEQDLDYPVLSDAEARGVHERFRKMVATAWFSLDTAITDLSGKKERRRAR